MKYFGGGGVTTKLHPSLKTYIACFLSPPFPKMYPRGGGLWDQDPILMRDFRTIAKFEREWKEIQEVQQGTEGGGQLGIEDALNDYINSMDENPYF